MAWKEARGSTRVVVAVARSVAHSDDAKSRTHDASSLARRGFPRKLLIGGIALALVVVGGVVAVFALGGEDSSPAKRTALIDVPSPSISAAAAGPSPEETMASSQPAGVWRAQVVGRTSVTRSGATKPYRHKEKATRWTFSSDSCNAAGCSGKVSSNSGSDFDYTWNGRKLVVVRKGLTSTTDKLACVDPDTGQPVPIADAAARDTYTYAFAPFTGSATSMTSRIIVNVSTEFFGTCKATPDDTVKFIEDQVIAQLQVS